MARNKKGRTFSKSPINQDFHPGWVEGWPVDNFFLRYGLARWLRHLDYNVSEAASADEAMVLLSSTSDIDLVITDAQMPGKSNGWDLAEHIKHERSALPVIMVSGNAPPKTIGRIGVSQFVQKPYDLDTLAAFVAGLLTEVVAHRFVSKTA